MQAQWYKSSPEYRAFAEKYYCVDATPLLVKGGLAKSWEFGRWR